MSSPGGSGEWSWKEHGQQYYDPITGQPVSSSQPTGYSGGQQPKSMEYQGFGVFSGSQQQYPGMVTGYPEPEPLRKRRGPLIAALSVGAVVLIAVVTTMIVITSNASDQQVQRPLTTSSPPNSEPPSTGSNPSAAPQTPVVPGWQAVSVPRRQAVYDVPRDWAPEAPNNIIAFGEPNDAVTLSGVAIYRKGYCAGEASSFRALAGATARKGPNDTAVANETAQKLATFAYTVNGSAPRVTLSPPEPINLANGSMHGTRVAATVTPTAHSPCNPPTALVNVVSTNSDGQASVVHITIADQDVPDAIPTQTVQQISSTFRPAR